MGTRFQITLYASDEATSKRAAKAAFDRIAVLDGIMSDYKPASELMRLCQRAGGEPTPVSGDLFDVLLQTRRISELSDGAFDVTIGPVSRLWRRARKIHELPAADELTRARALVDYRNVVLDPRARTVQLLKPGMMLDLGGIGKGYAADEALAVLKKHGITRALVAAGGDVVVSGPPLGAEGWTVAIAQLSEGTKDSSRFLLLKDAAVSTSGDTEQFIEIDGKRYSHLIDPRTGIGLTERISVTVVAPRGALADPLTKVVSVLGPERGLALIDATEGAAATFVRKTESGEEPWCSRRFKTFLQKHSKD